MLSPTCLVQRRLLPRCSPLVAGRVAVDFCLRHDRRNHTYGRLAQPSSRAGPPMRRWPFHPPSRRTARQRACRRTPKAGHDMARISIAYGLLAGALAQRRLHHTTWVCRRLVLPWAATTNGGSRANRVRRPTFPRVARWRTGGFSRPRITAHGIASPRLASWDASADGGRAVPLATPVPARVRSLDGGAAAATLRSIVVVAAAQTGGTSQGVSPRRGGATLIPWLA